MSDLPELNLFMMCCEVNADAMSDLPKNFYFRFLKPNELDKWKELPFDDYNDAMKYKPFMTNYFNNVYGKNISKFYNSCYVVCDKNDNIVASCFLWNSYGKITTLHWLKVVKSYEGLGIGRALISKVLQNLPNNTFPIYLHTQPESFRAIKLYSDFGFKLVLNKKIGFRKNNLEESLPYLKEKMEENFDKLSFIKAPALFDKIAKSSKIEEF